MISSRAPLRLVLPRWYNCLDAAGRLALCHRTAAPSTIKGPSFVPSSFLSHVPPSFAMPTNTFYRRSSRSDSSSHNMFPYDSAMKDATPLMNFDDNSCFNYSPTDGDQMIFGPLEFDEGHLYSPSMPLSWDSLQDYSPHNNMSPTLSVPPLSPRDQFDFSVTDASSPSNTFFDSGSFAGMGDVQSTLPDFDDNKYLSSWLNEPLLPAPESSSSPIPIRGAISDQHSPPAFLPYVDLHPFPQNASFSPSDFAALHPLPRSLSPTDASDDYLSSPGQPLMSISPGDTSLQPPAWASQLWNESNYPRTTSSSRPPALHQPLSENPYPTKRQRFPMRRDASSLGQLFQSSSAPSPMQMNSPTLSRNYSRRADSVSVSDDRDATVRRRKRLPTEEPQLVEKASDTPPLKSTLKPPKLAPSAWQLYFTDWIQRHQATNTRKLNVAQAAKEAGQEYASLSTEEKEPYKRRSLALKEAREREHAAYMRTLTPEDIKRENAFRTAQRKAGKSRKSNIKDPNAPKKPLSAYFMFLQRIRSEPALVREVFGEEQETTKQSVLAAAKWRSMTDDERKPFLAQAEQEKLDYEAARRMYEEGTTGFGTSINFSILPGSPGESPFRALRPIKTESFSSESESEGVATDDGVDRYTRY